MIWKLPREGKSLLPIFDWERNFMLWFWIADILPFSEVLVSTGIYDFVRIKAIARYPAEWKRLKHVLRDTGRTQWNHHLHAHCDFGASGRPGGFDIDWDRERAWLCCQ
jgi:hypothetical protein